MLGQRGIRPEELPPAEDIKKLERRVASEQKKIEKSSPKNKRTTSRSLCVILCVRNKRTELWQSIIFWRKE